MNSRTAIRFVCSAMAVVAVAGFSFAQNGHWGPVMTPTAGTWPTGLSPAHIVGMRDGMYGMWGVLSTDPGDTTPGTQAWVWNGRTHAFTSMIKDPRYRLHFVDGHCSGHAPDADGTPWVVGGERLGASGVGITEVYTFDVNAGWIRQRDLNRARWYPTVLRLADRRLTAISGEDENHVTVPTPEVSTPPFGMWDVLTPNPPDVVPDNYPFMFTIHDPAGATKAFFAGKRTPQYLFQSFLLTVPTEGTTATWEPIGQPDFQLQGSGAVIWIGGTHPMKRGMIIKGGGIGGNAATALCGMFDLDGTDQRWVAIASMNNARMDCNFVLGADGKIYVFGGSTLPFSGGQNVVIPEVYDPPTPQNQNPVWRNLTATTEPRSYHSIGAVQPTAAILLAGHKNTDGSHVESGQIFYPPYLEAGAGPTITGVQSEIMQYNTTFRIDTPFPNSVGKVSLLALPSATHGQDMNQRYINMTKVGGMQMMAAPPSVTVYTPKNEGIAPPGYYMLFLIGTNGAPSAARQIRVG